jgi:hypothetical protein
LTLYSCYECVFLSSPEGVNAHDGGFNGGNVAAAGLR